MTMWIKICGLDFSSNGNLPMCIWKYYSGELMHGTNLFTLYGECAVIQCTESDNGSVKKNEWSVVYLCVSQDDSCTCSFAFCQLQPAPLIVTCVTLWFHSCVEFKWQYMLDLYTLCYQLCIYMESVGFMAEQKNAKLSSWIWFGVFCLTGQQHNLLHGSEVTVDAHL